MKGKGNQSNSLVLESEMISLVDLESRWASCIDGMSKSKYMRDER